MPIIHNCSACLEREALERARPVRVPSIRYHYEALAEDGGEFRSLLHAVKISKGNRSALCGYLIPKRNRRGARA